MFCPLPYSNRLLNMLEIVLLYFLTKSIGVLAVKKGQPPVRWKLILIAAWILFEFTGLFFGIAFFGTTNLIGLMLIGLASAFGGYLLVRYILENKPDYNSYDDIDRIGKKE